MTRQKLLIPAGNIKSIVNLNFTFGAQNALGFQNLVKIVHFEAQAKYFYFIQAESYFGNLTITL